MQHQKDQWIKNKITITDEHVNIVMDKCQNIDFPIFCKMKGKIIKFYLIVRCKGIQNHLQTKTAKLQSYSSVSALKNLKCKRFIRNIFVFGIYFLTSL